MSSPAVRSALRLRPVQIGVLLVAVAIGVALAVALRNGGGSAGSARSAGPRGGSSGGGAVSPGSTAPSNPPANPRSLAAEFTSAQRTIDDARSPAGALMSAGEFQQLATRELALGSQRLRNATLRDLSGAAAVSMRVNLAAADALTTIVAPQKRLPHWRIIAPPRPPTLLGYVRAAQARYKVPWEVLAAVEFVETKFGRIRGLSTAGAEGPMQFLPATWARYGRGDINDPKAAILGAARYLVTNGARRDMSGALYHYNPSQSYVRAVEAYAGRMRRDPRAFFGYYYWRVFYDHVGGEVILPVGYPRIRPIPIP